MNKRIRKKKQQPKPDLQTAWNVVAEELNKDGAVCYFVVGAHKYTDWKLHSTKNTLITSTIGGNK